MAVGRISGPLLKANLLRNGVNLAFETDLLYLDVINGMVGIKTATPGYDLDVNGTTRTTDATITNQLDVATFTISGNTIASSDPTINLTPSGTDPVIYQGKLEIHDISISNNTIEVTALGQNLEFTTQGSGQVIVNSNMLVNGDLHATGTITADGDINIGNANTDNVVFNADINSNIIPNLDAQYDLGSPSKRWNTAYAQNLVANSVVSDNITVNGIELTTTPGNSYFVSTNGTDTNAGNHPNSCFATISKALTVATAGDTVVVYPGAYEEVFPLEVPPGVTVHGTSLRSIIIKPTAATRYNDAFHMNGEATVEDLTLTGFYHDPLGSVPEFPINNQGTGHAFRFSWGCLTQKRSPYIRNITVITNGTPSELSINSIKTEVIGTLNRIKSLIPNIVQNLAVTGTTGNTQVQNTSLPASDLATATVIQGLIDTVVYVINNGTLLTNEPTLTANGTAVSSGMLYKAAQILEANRAWIVQESYSYPTATYAPTTFDETLTKRDMGLVLDALIYDVLRGGNEHSYYAGFGFWTQPTSDPRGYLRGDAGHGALVDGGAVNPASKEAAMLFHAVTFLTPAADTLIATNGSRIEWLNSFTYFAGKGLYAYSSPEGYAQAGLTRLRIDNRTGTWAVGNTVTYYDTDGTTVLASGVVDSISGNYVNLTSRCLGFETITDRVGKTVSVSGNAKLSTAQQKWGPSSLALDGTGDYISLASQPDFEFGTGDFTIETWVYRNNTTGVQTIFDFRSTTPTDAPWLYFNGTNLVYYVAGVATINVASAVPNISQWYHIAVSRSGTNTKMFVNGSQVGSTWTDATNYIQSRLTIGASYTGATQFLNGYLDDIKISKGVARYTSNFTAPTTALTGDLSTVLLLHFNGANNSTTILDDGITYQDIRTSAGGTASLINFADYSDFGAEIRSIGSANVYGDYGAYGDGPGVIAYLISQNFAYVGAGALTTNDPNDRIEANEVVELNGAHIYRTSVDNEGNFQVGNNFYVNQKTGDVYFNNQSLSISAPAGVTFTDGVNSTVILPESITTGNIKISGNTIESLTGDVNVTSASGAINLQNDTYVTGNLDVTGDVTIGGNITIGDASTDTVNFVGQINSNLVPATTNLYDLGTTAKRWNNAYVNKVIVDNLTIDNNTISTTVAGTDLTLTANGTGIISIPSNDVAVTGNMNVDGVTTLTSVGTALTVNGAFNQTGNYTQTGNFVQVGNTDITGNLTVSTWGQFQSIRVDANEISVTATNTNLVLKANGTGIVSVPNNDVSFGQDLTVTGTAGIGTLNVTGTTTSNAFTTGDILIDDNYITTTITNHNLELRANGTGIISVPTNNVEITNNLTVTTGDTSLQDTTVVGAITHTGNTTQTGSYTQTGDVDITGTLTVSSTAQFENIKINSNVIETTVTNTDLQLEASGTGKIYVPFDDVYFGQNLTVDGVASFGDLSVTGTITTNAITTGDILIDDNYITTTITNHNLELRADGTGKIVVPSNDVEITNNLTVNGTTSLNKNPLLGNALEITGSVLQTGNLTQTGTTTQYGDATIHGSLNATIGQFEKIRIASTEISTTTANTDLVLKANGTGIISVPSNNVEFDQDLTVNGITTLNSVTVTNGINANSFTTGDILVDDNYITTTITNHDLELSADGTGQVVVPTNDVLLGQDLTVQGSLTVTTGTTTFHDLTINGTITQTGDYTQTGNFTTTGNTEVTGNVTGTGYLQLPQLKFENNTISARTTNTDINLVVNGTGSVVAEDLAIRSNEIRSLTTNSNITLTPQGTGQVIINSNQSLILPSGNNSTRPSTPSVGAVRYNTQLSRYEGWNGSYWITLGGVQDVDGNTKITAELTPGANDNTIRFYVDGTLMSYIDATKWYAERIETSNLAIYDNNITTVSTNTNINLTTTGTGGVLIGNLRIRNNTITNIVSGAITEFVETGTGYVKISGTNGFVIPSGDTVNDRPTVVETGMLRFNTQLNVVEIFDGVIWTSVAGTSGGVSQAEATDIALAIVLSLG
jgi:hypothetical protein